MAHSTAVNRDSRYAYVSLHVVESELTSEPRSRAFDGLD
jgi:hypothetical protein